MMCSYVLVFIFILYFLYFIFGHTLSSEGERKREREREREREECKEYMKRILFYKTYEKLLIQEFWFCFLIYS